MNHVVAPPGVDFAPHRKSGSPAAVMMLTSERACSNAVAPLYADKLISMATGRCPLSRCSGQKMKRADMYIDLISIRSVR
jgi:hypothetical protein